MDLGLAGRSYVVTAGSRGLGLATARCLVADGARVVVSGRDRSRLDAAVDELGEQAVGVVADNADPATPALLVGAAREHAGRLDGAVLSVGGPPAGRVQETTDEQWRAAFESVFLGGVRLAREVGAALTEGGAIALVLSSSVRAPLPAMAISNGLRPGLAMVAKQLADELGPRGVRVNAVLPGRVETDRVRELDDLAEDPAAARERARASIPLRRYGEPDELGRVATFLVSPAASFVSGAMVPVDGGLLRAL